MTFDEHWTSVCKANSDLNDSAKIRITKEAFQSALRRAFEAGMQSGIKVGESSLSIFEKMFGK